MHSKIFQITETRVSKDNYLNEDTLTQGDDSFFDYCAEIDDEERQFHIDNLVNNILPKGMFELVSDDTIRYKGGAERWREDFVADIRSRAEALTPESVQDWIGPVYQLEKFLKNPLDTAYWFYMDEEGLQSNAEQSYEFLRQVCEFKPGTLLYIGGVIDYHFNLKTLNDERYGAFQTDYQGILGRQGTDGRTFRCLLCQRKQELGRLYHVHSQSSQGKRLLRNDRRRGVVARHSLL